MSDDRLLAARILAAADADRRQFERRLHDGAQQSLAVIAMKLQLARAADEPTALLGEIAADVDDAVAELRELARLLHPPLHGQRGLATALRAAASALELQVELRVEPVEPAEAVYLCCAGILEAAGQRASVTIRSEPGLVVFEVDGSFDPEAAALGRVADRVEALGGAFSVDSSRVAGSIPGQALSAR